MVFQFLVILTLGITGILLSLQFFKYLSPKEKKELNSQRDKLFKEVEKLIKKENFLEVIDAFDQISSISEKLGDTAVAEEFKERADKLRSQLGQEVKIDVADLQEKINFFLMQLMAGPYGEEEVLPLAASAVPQSSSVAVPVAPSRSLIDEGADIIARLKKFKGEEGEEKATIIESPASPITPPIAVTPPPRAPPSPASPPPRVSPPPRAPPSPATSPPRVSPPPRAPPSPASPPPRVSPPPRTPPSPASPPPPTPSTTPSPPPINLPAGTAEAPKSIVDEGAEILARLKKFKGEPVEVKPSSTPSSSTPSSAESLFTPQPSSSPPIAVPIPDMSNSSELESIEMSDTTEEPAVHLFDPGSKTAPEKKLDEKEEIIERLKQELPLLPEKMKKKIIKELLKRPSGKLRETWLKVYIHKNKQYAEQ